MPQPIAALPPPPGISGWMYFINTYEFYNPPFLYQGASLKMVFNGRNI
jgi:hypothetical protein